MKVLIVNSSPRKGGNCEVLCRQFKSGAEESGNNVEYVAINDIDISPCKACYACLQTKKCAIKDGFEEVFAKLMDADVIVLASPVYFYSVSAQLKAFIDRCFVNYMGLKNKRFYFIITAADSNVSAADGTLKDLRGYLKCLPGAKEQDAILAMGAWNIGDAKKLNAYSQAYEMAKRIG